MAEPRSDPGLPPGYRLAAFDTIPSTNDEAKRLAADGVPEGTVVWARAQTAGRGRQARTWQSPDGNLFCSLVLRPGTGPERSASLGFVAALAMAEAIEELAASMRATLKWPNDVLVRGRKIGGILLEGGDAGAWVVVGCGLNLAEHPKGVPFPATSVAAECGQRAPAVETALPALCSRFDAWYRRWAKEGFAPIRSAWLARAHPPGTALSVRQPAATIDGAFRDLDTDGVLLLEIADGSVRRIAAGDVYFRDSAPDGGPLQGTAP